MRYRRSLAPCVLDHGVLVLLDRPTLSTLQLAFRVARTPYHLKCYAITERMPDLGEVLREVNTGLSDIHRASLKQHLGRTEPGHK